jgi:uncharacterized protein DUF4440
MIRARVFSTALSLLMLGLACPPPVHAQAHKTRSASGALVACSCENGATTCGCKRWAINWEPRVKFTSVTARTRAEVQAKAEKKIASHKSWAELYNRTFPRDTPVDPTLYDQPSQPYCSGCQDTSWLTPADRKIDEAQELLQTGLERYGKLMKWHTQLKENWERLQKLKNADLEAFAQKYSVPKTLNEYADTLKAMWQRYREFQESLTTSTAGNLQALDRFLKDFDALSERTQATAQTLETQFQNLPSGTPATVLSSVGKLQTAVGLADGPLRDLILRVLQTDNDTVEEWAKDPSRIAGNVPPAQQAAFREFVVAIARYKDRLSSSFGLFTIRAPGTALDLKKQGQDAYTENTPLDIADELYRRILQADPSVFDTTSNYPCYQDAMLAKALAAWSLCQVVELQGKASPQDLKKVLEYAVVAARQVDAGLPAQLAGRNEETIKARDALLVAIKQKQAALDQAGRNVTQGGDSIDPNLVRSIKEQAAGLKQEAETFPRSTTSLSEFAQAPAPIQAQYIQMVDALESKDLDRAVRSLSPDYFYRTADGQSLSLAQWREARAQALQRLQSPRLIVRVEAVERQGSDVVVRLTQRTTAATGDVVEQKVRETWTQKGDAWLLQSTDEKWDRTGSDLPVASGDKEKFLALLKTADTAFEDGLFAKAAATYTEAWTLFPSRQDVALKAAGIWIDPLKDPLKAAAILRKVLSAPTDASADPGTRKKAEELLNGLKPELSVLYDAKYKQGLRLYDQNDLEAAETALLTATNADPERYEANLYLARLYGKRGNSHMMRPRLLRAVALGKLGIDFLMSYPEFRDRLQSEEFRTLLTDIYGAEEVEREIKAAPERARRDQERQKEQAEKARQELALAMLKQKYKPVHRYDIDDVYQYHISTDGRTLAVQHRTGAANLYDLANGELRSSIRLQDGSILAVSPNCTRLVAELAGQKLAVQSLPNGAWDDLDMAAMFKIHKYRPTLRVGQAAFSPDGQFIAIIVGGQESKHASHTYPVGLWDTATCRMVKMFKSPFNAQGMVLTFSLDGKMLLASQGTKTVLWSIDNGSLVAEIPFGITYPGTVSFGKDSRSITIGNSVVDLATLREVPAAAAAIGPTDAPHGTRPHPDGRVAVVLSLGHIQLWDMLNNSLLDTIHTMPSHPAPGYYAAWAQWSGDGRFLVVYGEEKATKTYKLKVWHIGSEPTPARGG